MLCGLVIAAAVAGKVVGCGVAARLNGFALRESACIGAMMNTRGLVGLIVANLGYELKVIPESVYCMLVLMALVTTLLTTPLLMRWMRGTELEPLILQSGFSQFPNKPRGGLPWVLSRTGVNAVISMPAASRAPRRARCGVSVSRLVCGRQPSPREL